MISYEMHMVLTIENQEAEIARLRNALELIANAEYGTDTPKLREAARLALVEEK